MTRKDYILIAEAIRQARQRTEHGAYLVGIKLAAESIADALAADNPRFDRERFMRAALGDK